MSKIQFSIIIPVYNVEKYLKRCIDSALEQKNVTTEIILVNDGSTDNSLRICKDYQEKYKQIIFIDQKNRGVAEARNQGIRRARGEYIVFLDSDDWINPNVLTKLAVLLEEKHPEILTITASVVDEQGNPVKSYGAMDWPTEKAFTGVEYFEKKHVEWQPMVWMYIFSTEFIKKKKLFFLKDVYHEDSEFMVRAIINARAIITTQILFYNYYQSMESIMHKRNIKKCYDLIQISEVLSVYFQKFFQHNITGRVKGNIQKYISYLAWESIKSCIKQGYCLKKFLNHREKTRKRIIHNIKGCHKYLIVKWILMFHLENWFLLFYSHGGS